MDRGFGGCAGTRAAEGRRLSGRSAFKFFDSTLERLNELAPARILGIKLLNALIARIGFHTATPDTRATTRHREYALENRRAQMQFNFNRYPKGR